ncbi:MAG: hypothetical protein ACJ76N_08505 [Thermoanaerobaculia bacterium]
MEYRFDYSKAKPNRFANLAGKRRIVVVLKESAENSRDTRDTRDSKDLKDEKT